MFSQYVIGAGELLASALLIFTAFVPGYAWLQPLGAVLGLTIISAAVSFHLFTPLGVDPNKEGGGLFAAACLTWLCCAALLDLRAPLFPIFWARVAAFFSPALG